MPTWINTTQVVEIIVLPTRQIVQPDGTTKPGNPMVIVTYAGDAVRRYVFDTVPLAQAFVTSLQAIPGGWISAPDNQFVGGSFTFF